MIKKQNLLLLLAVLFLFQMQSCVKYKELVSLNRKDNAENKRSGQVLYESEVYPYQSHLLRPYDQLMIKVNANEGSTEQFINRENSYTREIRFDPPALYFNSYIVDETGYIYLPEIDSVYVKDLTVRQVKQKLDQAYKEYLKYASTSVKLANMRCTVIGEVNQPGVQFFFAEKTTLLDAIGMAGDFTDFASRKNVKLVRTLRNGNTKTAYLDLTTYEFVHTEFYYIQPDDIVYVEPVKAKSFDASSKAIGVVFSAISTLALIANLILR
ncbi:MAG: polysaccharide biosynthesis/export family protein [Saprospiraceae bacterium]